MSAIAFRGIFFLHDAGSDYPDAMPRSSIGTRTIDGARVLRCMVVGVSPEQEEACRRAIMPIEIVRSGDVREACASMSMVLPLIVVVDESMPDADRAALMDITTACGAELVTLDASSSGGKAFASLLLDAVRVAERRRIGAGG